MAPTYSENMAWLKETLFLYRFWTTERNKHISFKSDAVLFAMTLRTFLCQNIKISRAARYLTITDNVVATLGSSEPKSCNRKKKRKRKRKQSHKKVKVTCLEKGWNVIGYFHMGYGISSLILNFHQNCVILNK